jgi:thioredoxin-related protein
MKTLLLIAALAALAIPAKAAGLRDADQYFFDLNTGDLRTEAQDAKKAGKKALLVMFEQEGCPGCLYMKQQVLSRQDVQKFFRQRFVNLSVDIFGAVPMRDFAGRERVEKSYAQSLGISATPTFAFFDFDGAEIVRIVGPVKDAEEFMLLGEFVSSGAYRSTKFADYKSARLKKRGT